MAKNWPSTLWIIRHGESAANLSSRKAEASGQLTVHLASRDMDTPLSKYGEAQAAALGHWFADQPERPDIILSSPYLRTRQTVDAITPHWSENSQPTVHFDERLRERERGIFDGLTIAGVKEHLPDEFNKRQFLGKFYHRAPGGESWCDVVQRLRPIVEYVLSLYAGKHVMIVAHEVVIYCLRYIIEELSEEQILTIDAARDLGNCSVTQYVLEGEAMRRVKWAKVPFTVNGDAG
jgi:ribonuclease H / adenosylcobalamin/alpha-ribazole phosphatase